MFAPSSKPRLFACPPGADFPKSLVSGLRDRFDGQPPEALARLQLFVNTRRMARRITDLFNDGPAVLLPKIAPIADLALLPHADLPPAPVSSLRRRLELRRLVAALVQANPGFAPVSSVSDLSDSLAGLIDEMDGEGVSPEALTGLRSDEHAEHWRRTLAFLDIAARYTHAAGAEALGLAGRFRMVAERLAGEWPANPPPGPVLIAGSTGSRGTTALLMRVVACLPQGGLVIPGFDFDLPGPVWDTMRQAGGPEDHPQYRYAQLLRDLDMSPGDVARWHGQISPPQQARNRLVSLALRPAPVTSAWMKEAPALAPTLAAATSAVALVEAETGRDEALAVAFALREAAEEGRAAALVTTDHSLTRMVTAAMIDRWRIEPDASMGLPLMMSPAGVFMRMVLRLWSGDLATEDVLALLKHPFTSSGAGRIAHLDLTRRFELWARRKGRPRLGAADLTKFLSKIEQGSRSAEAGVWAGWLTGALGAVQSAADSRLEALLEAHIGLARTLAGGPLGGNDRELWARESGQQMWNFLAELGAEAAHGGTLSLAEYADLFEAFAVGREARDPTRPHPDIMIWGTLEARVQGADLLILAGLNEGSWPAHAGADPWLNRDLRAQAGMLLPERNIGLAAHDFQQAVAARRVILSRAKRDAEAETVPSRWLSRLTNLVQGIPETGEAALKDMRARGDRYLAAARALDGAVEAAEPAQRPAPVPPPGVGPGFLTVTDISSLTRDPYSVYARRILRLRRLDPVRPVPDVRLRGVVLHEVAEKFVNTADFSGDADKLEQDLLALSSALFDARCPWPETALHWQEKIARIAQGFVTDELARQRQIVATRTELTGQITIPEFDLALTGRADRIDLTSDGQAVIYDYKTGAPPTAAQVRSFEKQLLLEALLLAEGGFTKLGPRDTEKVAYIGLGSKPGVVTPEFGPETVARTRVELVELLSAYLTGGTGYASRRQVRTTRFEGDYDHLARLGEWDETDEPQRIMLT